MRPFSRGSSIGLKCDDDEKKENKNTHRDQGIAQVRPDKSSATGNENASRSSSWFRFDDGISVLVHFFVSFVVHLMRVFFVWCRNFLAHFGVEKKKE